MHLHDLTLISKSILMFSYKKSVSPGALQCPAMNKTTTQWYTPQGKEGWSLFPENNPTALGGKRQWDEADALLPCPHASESVCAPPQGHFGRWAVVLMTHPKKTGEKKNGEKMLKSIFF